ncbi:MAG: single-stranded-DNA-specific exonuclease RecJ [Alphaproteobacteria bacterium]|nr:single-stranded-DNA-specific exonuclease RecJ [Alphaproteobacteria bacterium]
MAEPAESLAYPQSFLGVGRSLTGRNWIEREHNARDAMTIAQRLAAPEIVGRLLAARGVAVDAAQTYLTPSFKTDLPDPSLFLDMDRAAERLADAVARAEKIAVFGDYDVDGATSSALLIRYFRALGLDVRLYIPDRLSEGYGPSVAAMRLLADEGAKIVVTVDCGTQANAALEAARDAGLDVIVADHHLPGDALPPAFAIVNPNRHDDRSGCGQLAAVGVAFMLAVAINRTLRARGWFAGRAEPDLRTWLGIVALGTVADVVPLTGVNRLLVWRGIEAMDANRVPGIDALKQVANLNGKIEPYHLGFVLGPRVNAGGRVGQCDLGARLLSTDDPAEARAIAAELDALNKQRQEIEKATCAEAIAVVEGDARLREAPVLVLARDGWHPGVIGIVASRLKDRYHRPTIVIAIQDGVGKGSGRSVAGVELGSIVVDAREAGLLVNGGGHAMAAGLTIAPDKIEAFATFMIERVGAAGLNSPEGRVLSVEGALRIEGATPDLCALVAKVGPFGAGNREPVFAFAAVRMVHAAVVGEDHVRCVFSDGKSRLNGIAFRALQTPLGKALLESKGRPLHVAATLKADEWQGQTRVQAQILDAAFV